MKEAKNDRSVFQDTLPSVRSGDRGGWLVELFICRRPVDSLLGLKCHDF